MNQRHPGRPKKIGPWPPCKFVGCEKTTENGAKGFCHTHYIYARRGIVDMETGQQLREFQRVASYGPGSLCSVEGCGRKARADGMCSAHWQRAKNGVSLATPIQQRASMPFVECLVAGCSSRANSRGMCPAHANRRQIGLIDDNGNWLRDPLPASRPRLERRIHDGYVLIQAPAGHPHARVDGSILEHRWVMEQALGRFLEDTEIVHHKDGNRSNNVWANLELLDGRSRHGEGHPPGSDFDLLTALQIVLQHDKLPAGVRFDLVNFRDQMSRG